MIRQHYLIVEHRQPELVKALRNEIFGLKDQIRRLKADHRALEIKYGAVVYLNLEMLDVMRSYDVPDHMIRALEKRANRFFSDL